MGWTRYPIQADLVHVPIEFDVVAIRIEKFYRHLRTCTPPPLKNDGDPVFAQLVASTKNIVKRTRLKCDVVQLVLVGRPRCPTDQRNAVMIGIATQKDHATWHHILAENVRDFKAQNARVKGQ